MIKRIVTYSIITIALAYSVQWLMCEGLRRNKQGVYHKYSTLFLQKNTYNSLVIGSSRAEMHLDVSLLDSLTGLNSFNAGVSGATTRVAYSVLQSYLVNSSTPKIVFFECDFHICHLHTDTIFNFPRYFPYLSNRELYKSYQSIDKRFAQFKYNPFYSLPYMGANFISPAIYGWTGNTGSYDAFYEKGFFRNELIDHYDHFDTKTYYGYISPETRSYLDSLITLCKHKDIKLVFTLSPAYKDAQKEVINKEQIIRQYSNIAAVNHIPLFNYSSDSSICNHKKYFEDNYHMLYPGARIYTQKIAGDFNNIRR